MRKGLLAIVIALAAMYAAGIACMFFGRIEMGAALWILSTVIGLAVLWLEDRRKKRSSAASEDSGADAGEPEGPPDNTRG